MLKSVQIIQYVSIITYGGLIDQINVCAGFPRNVASGNVWILPKRKLLKSFQKNSTSFDEDACCDRKISHSDDEDCGCPNQDLYQVHGTYPGYRDPSLRFPPGYCPGVSAWCKRSQNTGFSKEACCGGDCPCSCPNPARCPNPALFPSQESGGIWGNLGEAGRSWTILRPVEVNIL